eukprot:6006877-Pleurochrysis_carterae.AAC.1
MHCPLPPQTFRGNDSAVRAAADAAVEWLVALHGYRHVLLDVCDGCDRCAGAAEARCAVRGAAARSLLWQGGGLARLLRHVRAHAASLGGALLLTSSVSAPLSPADSLIDSLTDPAVDLRLLDFVSLRVEAGGAARALADARASLGNRRVPMLFSSAACASGAACEADCAPTTESDCALGAAVAAGASWAVTLGCDGECKAGIDGGTPSAAPSPRRRTAPPMPPRRSRNRRRRTRHRP